jgi:acetyl-CoA acetyltransferase
MNRIGRRVAIIEGCRTPFAKSGTDFKDLTSTDLG